MKLWKFYWYCGRMGELSGVFVATEKEVNAVIGQEIDFGEVLGKHSKIAGPLKPEDVREMAVSYEFIKEFDEVFGSIGYNPLDYIREWEEEESYEDL